MSKKKERVDLVDHLESGGERLRLTKGDQALLKKGATIILRDVCCSCDFEHLYVWEQATNGDLVERVYRDDVATKKNRKKK